MPNYHGFDKIATLPNKRTKLDSLSYEKKMTISQGDLRPVYFQEVLPGMMIHLRDAFSIKNIPSPLQSVIDDAYLDISYFFVPRRLLWKDWEPFIGADATPDAYSDPQSYVEPTCHVNVASFGGISLGSVMNDFGIPKINADIKDISPFPFACYSFVWNEFYRDESIQDENPMHAIVYNLQSGADLNLGTSDYNWLHQNTQYPMNSVNKYHDVFTSLLPKPQKGEPVSLPIAGLAQLRTASPVYQFDQGGSVRIEGQTYSGTGYLGIGDDAGEPVLMLNTLGGSAWDGVNSDMVSKTNVYADLGSGNPISVNDLRLAFASQAYLEALARGGSRYTELLHQMFGVSPSDARLQRPEFLGTLHKRLSFTSVASTDGPRSMQATMNARPTGALGGYSVTGGDQDIFFKQFEEHGYVIGLASIRVRHTYGQGYPKVFLKKDRFDYWSKYFDRIGEVPVDKREIFATGTGALGFQEAWYEYKFHPNEISGLIAPQSTLDLRAYTYADNFGAEPVLDTDFIRETRDNIDQTLLGSDGLPQYVMDIFHQVTAVVPLSVTSVPAGIGF